MYKQLLQAILKQPMRLYMLILFMVIISLAMLPQINIDTDPENMLNANAPARVFHQQVKHDFVMRDMIVVGIVSKSNLFELESLNTIHSLSNNISQIDGVIAADLLSLSTVDNISQTQDGELHFSYLMKQAPQTQQQSKQIQDAIKNLPLLDNTLVSSDNKAIAIYVPIKAKDQSYKIAQQIRLLFNDTATNKNKHDLQFHITGLPIAEDQFGVEMFVQMGVAAPLAGLAIFVLLWLFFRSLALIMAPMLTAMATVIIIMGTLIGFGFTVHIMSSMIAIFLMPIAVVDSVHLLSEFSERFKPGLKAKQVITEVMSHLFTPMLYTSITSAVGFYSLMLTPIPPVKVFGAFIGTGILLAFVLTITFVPAYISRLSEANLLKLQQVLHANKKESLLSRLIQKLGIKSLNNAKLLILSFIAVAIFSIEGITKIQINDNPINWFKADHEIRIADKKLNTHFAGTYDAWLVLQHKTEQQTQAKQAFISLLEQTKQNNIQFNELNTYIDENPSPFFKPDLLMLLDDISFSYEEEDEAKYQLGEHILAQLYTAAQHQTAKQQAFLQPDILKYVDQLQASLLDSGLIGKSSSVVDIVKTVNRELHSGQKQDFVIPSNKKAVAQTLLQYQSSHRPQDLWHFVDKNYQQSLIWLQLTSGDNQHMSKVVDYVERYTKTNPIPDGLSLNWAGKSYINVIWQDAMVNGMIDSLSSSFILVFLMMIILFRSLKYGILAMLPLSFTITLIYGLIGWFGKTYDMPIAVLSALTLGLSIDFAIHFLQRTRELEQQTGDLKQALLLMFQEPSRAIVKNAIIIAVGFTPLLLSPLVPYITVGFFLASIMSISALVSLVLLPALLSLKFKNKTIN